MSASNNPATVGGPGGHIFSTGVVGKVKSVSIRSGYRIDRIQLGYSSGATSDIYGGSGGNEPVQFNADGDEVIVAIIGRAGGRVDSLQFVTSNGTVSSFNGGTGGDPFTFQAPPGNFLVGIQGRCGAELDAFAPIWGTNA